MRLALLALLVLGANQEKRLPPPGIDVPAADRAELESGVKDLAGALESVKSHELAPDVLIYHKAVDWALRYNEFYSPREIAAAKQILKQGLERARALKDGKAPWDSAVGLVVRGYRSRIDGSVQPYGLVVPAGYDPAKKRAPYRLDFWLHGRDEKLTELKFIDQRQKSPGEFTPPDTFVLHLHGRLCNASKFAGEMDLFEALAHVRQRYPIDENRLVVRGFSMGGASTWHLAAHHAGLWAAAAPGAGFAETPVYANMFKDAVAPTAVEQKLWHWYNATDYAANLSNCPVVAYSGELDKQKQAADIMAKAMKEEGLDLAHVIGPKVEHKYEPKAKEEVARRIDELATRGRDPFPMKLRFTTWTLRYNRMKWLTVDALDRHWERTRVDAEVAQGALAVTTTNVSAFSVEFPAARNPIGSKAVVDGQPLELQAAPLGEIWRARFQKAAGRWAQATVSSPAGHGKRHGLQGPIDDAFMDSFLMVTPTGMPMNEKAGAWIKAEQDEAIAGWRRFFRGDARVVKDTDLKDSDLAAHHLVLWGDPGSNKFLSRISGKLPVQWDAKEVRVGGTSFPAEKHVPLLIYPNPLSPDRYVVLNSGYTFRENSAASNSRHVPLLPDWAVLSTEAPATDRMSQRVVAAGFFDEQWALPKE